MFQLQDSSGGSVPCQATVLGMWKDGSARWVLLDFQSAGGSYTLTPPDSAIPEVTPEVPVEARAGGLVVKSGSIEIRPAKDALLEIAGVGAIRFSVTAEDGQEYLAKAESSKVETAGEMRSTLALAGSFRDDKNNRLFGFRLWVSLYAGLSRVLIEPMVLMDAEKGVIQKFREIRLEFRPVRAASDAAIGGEPGWKGAAGQSARLMQIDDRQFVIEGSKHKGGKAPGWAEIGGNAVALRDFWQQWPKAMEISDGALSVGLFPRFEAGAFSHMFDPWYKHDYLFEGNCYRMRAGQVRRWQVWLDVEGKGDALAAHANAPLVPAADPAQAVATGLFGDIMPAGGPEMAEYDSWSANLFQAYQEAVDYSRDYGAMNWGDWFGERGVNWGNHEYDTPRQFLVQFGRTGDPKYLHTGALCARHMSEVDVVHFVNSDLARYFTTDIPPAEGYPPRPGMVHEHSVGHVGGFHSVETVRKLYLEKNIGNTDKPYLCLDPYNLGHIFTDGMMLAYFLTGDPWLRETLDRIGGNIAKLAEDRRYKFKGHAHCGRTNGWTMLALAACYELDHNERYLKAMKLLADDAIEEQDPWCGGWLYELPWGHCNCQTNKHVGEAIFLGSIRINGLYRYYRLTGDERIPDVIQRGIDHMNRGAYNELEHGWRYTSCPGTWNSVSRHGVSILAVSSSIRISGDKEHLRILRDVWQALFDKLKTAPKPGAGVGKGLSSQLLGCPETASLLAERREC